MRQTTGFVRLPDGRRIAFAVVGSGPAVVLPAWWVKSGDWAIGGQSLTTEAVHALARGDVSVPV